jgi:hypothetical protein
MSSFAKSHINFASLGRSLNFGQSSPILLDKMESGLLSDAYIDHWNEIAYNILTT